MQRSCISCCGQVAQCFSSSRNLADVAHRRDQRCVAHAKRKKIKPKSEVVEDAPDMSEEVKASFYLRFSDVLGEDPATAMQKIVDGGIKIDSDFVQTLQKQKKDAEEALKAAKLLAKVSGDSFVDAGLDISMKEEYEKAKKILDSTEQMWDSLKTDDVIPERTRGQAASPARPRSQSLEQQIMRETLGGSSNESAQARPPAGGNSAGVPMNLYDQMDALLGSISDGSFSSPSTPAPTGPSSASGAKPPPLRAPKRPQQLQDQQERPEQPAHVAPGPPPALAGRPALGAASARAAADEEDLSRAELESRAVELEEELFQGGAGDGLAEAEAVSMARERIQALRTGDANVGGGSGMSGGSLEDRFPDLADSDGVTMEALLNQKPEPRAADVHSNVVVGHSDRPRQSELSGGVAGDGSAAQTQRRHEMCVCVCMRGSGVMASLLCGGRRSRRNLSHHRSRQRRLLRGPKCDRRRPQSHRNPDPKQFSPSRTRRHPICPLQPLRPQIHNALQSSPHRLLHAGSHHASSRSRPLLPASKR
eukprot:jgi/Ulvmu1/2051/UM120_0047.1